MIDDTISKGFNKVLNIKANDKIINEIIIMFNLIVLINNFIISNIGIIFCKVIIIRLFIQLICLEIWVIHLWNGKNPNFTLNDINIVVDIKLNISEDTKIGFCIVLTKNTPIEESVWKINNIIKGSFL